jgi:hypothetical protein
MSQSVVQLDVIDNALQRVFANAQATALLLDQLDEESASALRQAQRAAITSEESLGLAGELTKAITTRLKDLEEERKKFTVPLDDAKAKVMAAFKPAKENFESAKDMLRVKSSAYLTAENQRRQREALAEQERVRELARKEAEQAAEDGDLEAATGILETAAEIAQQAKPAPVAARGAFGTLTTGQRVISGEVTDLKAFIKFLATPEGSLLSDIIGLGAIVEAKKAGLNKLAKAAVEKKLSIPGLTISDTQEARAR